jgi:hypothetical protein
MSKITGYYQVHEGKRTRLEQPRNKPLVEYALGVAVCLLLGFMGQESLLFTVNLILSGVEIGFVGFDHLGLHNEFVAENADQIDGDTLSRELVLFTTKMAWADLQCNQ